MNIFYLANIRLPTEKAHGLTIVKACDALARAGATVTLIIPRRSTYIKTDIFETYGVKKTFSVRTVPTINFLHTKGRAAFWFVQVLFMIYVFFVLLFSSKKNAAIYTRDVSLMLLSLLGMPVVLETHHIFSKRSLYFALARRARGIVTISHALKNTFIQAGFSEKNIIVEPSGVELSTFSLATPKEEARETLRLPQGTPIIIYTGNFTTMGQDKGIHDILRAMQKLPEVLFVAVGGSDKDIERYLAQAHECKVEEQVRFVGFAQQPTLALYQRAADVLLMPFPDTPHYRSNMSPVKMFEYMAGGRPIIATDLPTIREVLHEHNAMIIPPGDATALARSVRTLIDDPALREKLATRAKEDVSRYSWNERSKRVLAFIMHVSAGN